MSKSTHFSGRLYRQMSDERQLAGVSKRTHGGCPRAARQLADYCQRPPEKISESQMRKFLLHLKNGRHFAYGSFRVAYCGVKFFYTRIGWRDWKTLSTMTLPSVEFITAHVTTEAGKRRHSLSSFIRWPVLLGIRTGERANEYRKTTNFALVV